MLILNSSKYLSHKLLFALSLLISSCATLKYKSTHIFKAFVQKYLCLVIHRDWNPVKTAQKNITLGGEQIWLLPSNWCWCWGFHETNICLWIKWGWTPGTHLTHHTHSFRILTNNHLFQIIFKIVIVIDCPSSFCQVCYILCNEYII